MFFSLVQQVKHSPIEGSQTMRPHIMRTNFWFLLKLGSFYYRPLDTRRKDISQLSTMEKG